MDQQKIFKIWMAGFYEGEGSISNDKSNNNRLRLSISQNDNTPLIKAQEIWNGNLTKRIRKSPVSDKICTGYEWRLSHNDSLKFIEDIKPFMIIPYKINQINDALKSAKNGFCGKFKCNFCNLEYASPSGRRRHEIKEHINKGVLHKCSICSLEYKSKDSLNRHIKLKHSNKNSDASMNNISI